ncbi:hypothetical protein ACFSKN_08580 [Mariniflexile gromovii]|uniref:von Willebrand factor type A domain-containing protein n=1 Tax=Mariniflexile gromovii TaxID=362523 RepID=A0ABS4BU37_9FLAO|nr:hypothetical protein [Mariniflexile gromovii]MBP0904094.1 hypothetical protein [Mariniflexile gromovii]
MKKKKSKYILYATLVLIIVIILLFLFNKCCNKVIVENDGSKPSIAVLDTKIISQDNEEIRFAIRFVVFRDSKHSEDRLKRKDVRIDSLKRPSVFFEQKQFNKKSKKTKEPFSAILLLDQSGSMTSNDRDKKRFVATNIFNENFGQDNYLMLWSFGLRGNAFQSYSDGFVKDTFLFKKQIKELEATKASGSSPLFKAQDSTSKYLNKYAPTKIKALVSFTDGVAGGKAAYENTIATSLENEIPLYNICLLSKSKLLKQQAFDTHGAYIQVDNLKQLLSVFGNLGGIINGTSTTYYTEWTAKNLKGKFAKKGRFNHEMIIQLPYRDKTEIKLTFELEW